MVKVFTKKEEDNGEIEEVETLGNQENPGKQEDAFLLQSLKKEESELMEEKQNLASLKDSLQSKAKNEIENRKMNIQRLKDEISGLKVECEALAESLNAGLVPQ
jgi:hypothetical protein